MNEARGKAVAIRNSIAPLLIMLIFGLGLQNVTAQTARTAEQAFKNIQVLKGVPEDAIQPTMWFFTAALGVRCRYCHEDDNSVRERDTRPQKAVARRMIEMTMAINKNTFGGRPVVSCYTCHQGNPHPVGVPLVGEESKMAPDVAKAPEAAAVPKIEDILAKYETATGGAGAAQKLTSSVIKANVADVKGKTMAVDIAAKGPEGFMLVTHEHEGEVTVAMKGNVGWRNTAEQPKPREMKGADLEVVRLENPLYVAGRVKEAFLDMRVAPRPEQIDHRDNYVVMAKSTGALNVKLYFDKESGILSRLAYNIETPLGSYMTQIDYFDYRDAAGLKVPYRWKISRVRADISDYKVTDWKVNVPVEDAKFAKPN